MNNLFTKETCNTGRQRELDLAKGLAIVFMVLVHVNEVYMSAGVEGSTYQRVVEFLGSPPAAPIFMMLLGVGIVYSRRNDAKTLAIRGSKIFVLAYVLNFLRDFIPYMLLARRYEDEEYCIEAINSLFGVDILQFAGLTFLFFALLKKCNVKDRMIPVIWCMLAAVNLFVRGISFDSEWMNSVFGLFWGTDDYSWFPFLTWIFYPLLGYFFAKALVHCQDKKRFYRLLCGITGAVSIPLWLYSYLNEVEFGAFGEMYQNAYYQHDIMGNLVLGVFALFWISLMFYVAEVAPQIVHAACGRWSRNINHMYCIHWILLGYSMLLLEEEAFGPGVIMMISVVIFCLTDFLCIRINKRKV